ncbi:MAG: amidohydrolase family protein, partial [Verrucomicrobiota bacterium]
NREAHPAWHERSEGNSVPAIFKTGPKNTTLNSNKTMMKKYLDVSVLLMSLTLGNGIMRAEEPAKAPEGRFIDAHVHFHDRNPGDLDKAAEWMKANNVQRIINHPLMQSRANNDKERAQQIENYKPYKSSMARFCIVYSDEVNNVDEAVAILTREKQAGAVGFGEHYGSLFKPQPGAKSQFIDDPKSMVLFAACEKVGLPVMFHMDRGSNLDEKDFPHLQNILKTYPKCIFIAHSDWWRSITDGSCGRLLETYPNLYADISCSVGRSPVGKDKAMAREFFIKHADKLLFGSDNGWWSFKPGAKPALEYAFIDEIKLPKDVEDKICRDNAKQLFWNNK